MYLKQSTALTVILGPFLDDTDGKTPETALTVTSIEVDLYKGATKSDLTITASGGNNDMAHVANGYYSLELTTGNTDTLGHLLVTANISGALPVWRSFVILPANVYDSLIGGSDALQVHTNEITNDLITANALAATATAEIANAVWDEVQATHTTAGTFGHYLDAEVSDVVAPTAAAVADAVWDEGLGAHLIAGSAGDALNDAGGTTTDPWQTALPGSYTAGQAGYIVGQRLDAKVSSVSGGSPGAGATEFTYTLTETGTGDPIADADVWATSDVSGEDVLASGRTNSSGQVTFYLDSGTTYFWRQKNGWNFTNPDTESVG